MANRNLTPKLLAVAVGAALFHHPALAQHTVGWLVSEPSVACDGKDRAGHGTVYSAPPSDIVPSMPATIVGRKIWWQGQVLAPVTSFNSSGSFVTSNYGTAGSVNLQFDKGGAYVAATGFPNSQLPAGFTVAQSEQDTTALYHSLTLLGTVSIGANIAHQSEYEPFNPPLIWNAGDKVFSGYACAGGGGIQMGWEIYFQVP